MGTPRGCICAYRHAALFHGMDKHSSKIGYCLILRNIRRGIRVFIIFFPDTVFPTNCPPSLADPRTFLPFTGGLLFFIYAVTHMPYKAKRPCKYPGCPNLTDRDYCAEHISQARYEYEHYRRDPETKKRYGSQWRKIRALYVKAHPLCEECLKHGRTTPVEQVHHIVPLSDGGTHDFSNLMSLCKSCHSAITIAETNRKR